MKLITKNSKIYKERIEKAKTRYAEDFEELVKMDVNITKF